MDGNLRKGQRGLPGGSSLARLLAEHRGLPWRPPPPPLTIDQILAWADAHHETTGRWPNLLSGPVVQEPSETWIAVDHALRSGGRGLPGGSSLPGLLAERRGTRNPRALPRLTVRQILTWADGHHQRTGQWPNALSGQVEGSHGETWKAIDHGLRNGSRGLRGGSSLPRLLAECRGVPNPASLPPLSVEQVLMWADAHHERTGRWPYAGSGRIDEEPSLTWGAINRNLRSGFRGLPHGLTLGILLAARRGARTQCSLPPLTVDQILAWADAHWEQTGRWPNAESGFVGGEPFETWGGINSALARGGRGLPGGATLAKLLAEHRGVRSHRALPKLDVARILTWADRHYRRMGRWPTALSGRIEGSSGETWGGVDGGLREGFRGLPSGSSLARLLAEHRGVTNKADVPALSIEQILAWADAHHERTGNWPNGRSGRVAEDPTTTWTGVDGALMRGYRGLPGGTSLARLLVAHRHVQNRCALPTLTKEQVLAWADAHHLRTGQWPTTHSGPIAESQGDTWRGVDHALRSGYRGLGRGSSLMRLLAKHRNVRNAKCLPPLTVTRILAWADEHHQRTGQWPNGRSGAVTGTVGETWLLIDNALKGGWCGLAGGSSLARLFAEHRGVRNRSNLPPLTVAEILDWADAHHERNGRWPQRLSGVVCESPGETWCGVDHALKAGRRGLLGGSSLSRLFEEHRGVPQGLKARPLSIEEILAWAAEHHRRTGEWPDRKSGPVVGREFEGTWAAIDDDLRRGFRCLPGGVSLRALLLEHCRDSRESGGP